MSKQINKEQVLKFIKNNCIMSSCLMCRTADKYGCYQKCPFLKLKQKAKLGTITIDDIGDDAE